MIKKIIIIITTIVLTLLLVVGGYALYITLQYSRIEDNLLLEVKNNQSELEKKESYQILTYNIGFGAYNRDFSFFMDSGEMLDGSKTSGKYSRARSKDIVLENTNGGISLIQEINPDFMFIQEIDTKSHRSRNVNQVDLFTNTFNDYANSYAINSHSAYLFYPLNNPIGTMNSGILTMSKYKIDSSTRYQFPLDNNWPTKFFDLDRCFQISRISFNGKELVLINIHMSAYDEGGKIRALQMNLLNQVLKEEYEKGNYVIAGGDFNHDIADFKNLFATEQKIPNWVGTFPREDLPKEYSVASSNAYPTCRSTDMSYTEGVNYSIVVDGFIISDNIKINAVTNIAYGSEYESFKYSDHNPVLLDFSFLG